MSNSTRPHRQQPTRLRRPWDSPSKNTGVGCHFLLQCTKVKSESEVTESCPTLSDPMDCSLPGSSVHGIFQARVLEWGAIAFSVTDLEKSKLFAQFTFWKAEEGLWLASWLLRSGQIKYGHLALRRWLWQVCGLEEKVSRRRELFYICIIQYSSH